ncbi:uncharacterized protein DDB_G0287625-like [Thrips palmi]|uniref:Regulatory protein zeste n=1 Tax=Thrips palmi TaxID=161013 RepID=A0A6P8ZUM6_THRPL|nr:uncharacterized protein DDB_G0287625-like [Thrips palmi]
MPNPPPRIRLPVTEDQKEFLLGYMEQNIPFSQGEFTGPMGKEELRKEWDSLALLLNEVPGANKDGPKWKSYWSDMKDAVKQAAQEYTRISKRGTGGGPPPPELSDHQLRVLTCMGGWKRVVGFMGAKDPLQIEMNPSGSLSAIMKRSKINNHHITPERSSSRRRHSRSTSSRSRSRGRSSRKRTRSSSRRRHSRSTSSRSRSRGRSSRKRTRSSSRRRHSRSTSSRSRSRGRSSRKRSRSSSRRRHSRSTSSRSRSRGSSSRKRSKSSSRRQRSRSTSSRSRSGSASTSAGSAKFSDGIG